MKMLRAVIISGIASFAATIACASPILTLLPNSSLSGAPGSTIGWGYTLDNTDPNFWYVPSSISIPSFSIGTPVALFDYPSVAPMSSVTQAYNGTQGLLQLTISPSASLGAVDNGSIVLSGDYYNGDPYTDPNAAITSSAPDVTASITTTVSGTQTPEPNLGWAAMCLLISLLAAERLRESRSPELTRAISVSLPIIVPASSTPGAGVPCTPISPPRLSACVPRTCKSRHQPEATRS